KGWIRSPVIRVEPLARSASAGRTPPQRALRARDSPEARMNLRNPRRGEGFICSSVAQGVHEPEAPAQARLFPRALRDRESLRTIDVQSELSPSTRSLDQAVAFRIAKGRAGNAKREVRREKARTGSPWAYSPWIS